MAASAAVLRDVMPVQLADLGFADACDEGQMVVGPPPVIAMTAPSTNFAMLDRFGIGRIGDASETERSKLSLTCR